MEDGAVAQDIAGQLAVLAHFLPQIQGTFRGLAAQLKVTIVAPSIPLMAAGKLVNRVFVFSPNGTIAYQDKWFITPFEKADLGVVSGDKVLTVFETAKGNFGIQICYDGEFSLGSSVLAQSGADIILVPSCTETIQGATRVHVGARARALENQCYTMVSQTIGDAPFSQVVDINYGYCGAYSTPDIGFPEEGIFQVSTPQQGTWLTQEFDLSLLATVRAQGAVRNYVDGMAVQSAYADGSAITVNRVKLF